ncbi:MAG TPA: acetate--CoA ligase family protein [Patescibacteria group bacterium]|nr:acetate--CoA ligase family protein [Patescibacteria group bacterium]
MGRSTRSLKEKVEKKLLEALGEGRDRLYEHEIYELLVMLGFRVPRTLFARTERELARLDISRIPGERLVCKLISPEMQHRFEYGGVRFVERAPEAVRESFSEFSHIAAGRSIEFSGMLIAEEIAGMNWMPYQLLVSLRQDPSFGPVVFLGMGGVGTEVFKAGLRSEKGLFIRAAAEVDNAPASERIIERTLFYPIIKGKTRISAEPLVRGNRIQEVVEGFAYLARTFSPLSNDSPVTIEELEVNPMQVTPEGDLVPLDGIIRLSRNKHDPMYPPQPGIHSLLEPESVLIIGASATKMNAGRIILQNILKGGRIGSDRIYVLHPEAGSIDGCRAFGSIADLPEPVDMSVFAIPATERAAVLLEEIIDRKMAKAITLISGGFGETEKGKKLDRRLHDVIREGRERDGVGVVVNGPNCLGIVSRPGGYNTFFLPEYKLPFVGKYGDRTAFISQSGAYLVTVVSNMGQLISPKYMITYGNQMDLTVTDYLIYMKDDPEIDFFCLYIEGFKPYDGERFLGVAKEILASGKKIIAYKTGRTKAGAAAVASHTASMAGDYEVLHRILTDAGVIMPDTLNEVEDTIKIFALLTDKKVAGNRVAIFGNAGFECSVAADRLYSMELARFSQNTVAALQEVLPTDIIDINNPVDATPQTDAVNYGKCIEAFDRDDGVDCIVAAVVAPTPFMETLPAGPEHREDLEHENSYPRVTIRLFEKTKKPMVVSVDSGTLYDPAVNMMEDAGVPCYRKIDRTMKALDNFLRHSRPPGK